MMIWKVTRSADKSRMAQTAKISLRRTKRMFQIREVHCLLPRTLVLERSSSLSRVSYLPKEGDSASLKRPCLQKKKTVIQMGSTTRMTVKTTVKTLE